MTEEKDYRDKLASMIKGIANKVSSKLYSRDTEDIEQDLWVKVLEAEKRKGHPLDLPLAARICYDYVKDMIDYDQRRNHFTNDFSGVDGDDEYANSQYIGSHTDHGNYISDIMLKDLYDKFPEGSKERIFLDFWGNESGAMPNTNVFPEITRNNGGFSENALARMLGYANAASGGYKAFRRRMRDIIADYYNLDK